MSVTDILSIQLYTLRMMESLDRILDTVADAGYRNVETVGSHLDDAAGVKAKLAARGLKASSSHVSLAALRDKPEAILHACRTLGFKDLFMPAVPPEQRDMPAEGWRSLGLELGRISERFHEHGIRLGYHNHHWELKPKEGEKTALELIFEAAGSSPLTWQVDVAWLARGGADPEHWIHRYRDRVTAAHVKDIAPTGQNEDQDGWTDVGAGILDWRDLWRICRDAGAEWMVVEHDKPADPARTARNSFIFLQNIED
ncbi:sugar phosphate isomerase/epimerase family protein [Microvirga puerhi]|uniref:Sugar phosphate isomerase/epimerase n=1 Tax=Microvirga puerhi TaxID=2876078 RepID=A0ABS7VMA8_9HYPH|nr:sugar phosphate isomerase/epimerase [Microvirga puerhi]MBZ6076669.1 sugar phosphate isomerase/epimerase [Microvirga puerhi]